MEVFALANKASIPEKAIFQLLCFVVVAGVFCRQKKTYII
jgi:hypothetical protein